MASNPQVLHHSTLEVAPPPFTAHKGAQPYTDDVPEGHGERKICGARMSTFLLLLALLLVILAAGIGGGVGGSMAVNNAKKCVISSLSSWYLRHCQTVSYFRDMMSILC